jgi:hypothetical protein
MFLTFFFWISLASWHMHQGEKTGHLVFSEAKLVFFCISYSKRDPLTASIAKLSADEWWHKCGEKLQFYTTILWCVMYTCLRKARKLSRVVYDMKRPSSFFFARQNCVIYYISQHESVSWAVWVKKWRNRKKEMCLQARNMFSSLVRSFFVLLWISTFSLSVTTLSTPDEDGN